VATGGEITHRVVETDEPYDATLLRQAANYINAEFKGLTLQEARAAIEARMREERQLYDVLAAHALRLARSGLSDVTPEETLHVQGASLLLDQLLGPNVDRDAALETLRVLFRMIEEKHRLIELLTECFDGTGLTIVIGSEHLSPELQPFSLIASTFSDGTRTGTIGVIGPTRMHYDRAITVVDGVSQVVTRVLERH
jgi:heat-inducible transcriptional repressor